MLPGPALMVPIYLILNKLGLSNRLLGLILVHTTLAIPITTLFMIFQKHFVRGMIEGSIKG